MTATPTRRAARAGLALAIAALALGLGACQGIICLADPDKEHLCEEPLDVIGQDIEVFGPVRTVAGVAYRVPAADRVTLLRTKNGAADIVHIEVPDNPTILRATPDLKGLLALSPSARALTHINAEDPSDTTTWELGSPFTTLSVSEDGRYAVAFAAGVGDGSAVIQNNNELAVIDLAAAPSDTNPQLVALRSFGSRPTSVQFLPPLMVQGTERRMALILSTGYITLLELDGFDPENPNANETVAHFTQDTDNRSLTVRKVLLTETEPGVDIEDDFFIFLLLNGSDDIISLNLLASGELDAFDRPRIRPSLNQLTGGRGPVDLELFETRDGQRKLLAVNQGSRDLAVIDVATSDTTLIPLEEPVDQALVYSTINRDTDRQEPFALLFSANGALRTVLFVELEAVEAVRTRAIDRLNLDRAIAGLAVSPDPNRALILHAGLSAFSILNLERRFVTPLDLTSTISDFEFASEDTLLTVLTGQPFVSWIELSNGHPTSVRLDLPAAAMAVIPETNTVVVDHGESLGGVTLMPLAEPSRDSATVLWGFGADDLFNVRD